MNTELLSLETLEAVRADVDARIERLKNPPKPKGTMWEPKEGEHRYIIYGSEKLTFGPTNHTSILFPRFKTKQEAQAYCDVYNFIREFDKDWVADWMDGDQAKYFLYYCFINQVVEWGRTWDMKNQGAIYLSQACKNALFEKFSQEQLKPFALGGSLND